MKYWKYRVYSAILQLCVVAIILYRPDAIWFHHEAWRGASRVFLFFNCGFYCLSQIFLFGNFQGDVQITNGAWFRTPYRTKRFIYRAGWRRPDRQLPRYDLVWSSSSNGDCSRCCECYGIFARCCASVFPRREGKFLSVSFWMKWGRETDELYHCPSFECHDWYVGLWITDIKWSKLLLRNAEFSFCVTLTPMFCEDDFCTVWIWVEQTRTTRPFRFPDGKTRRGNPSVWRDYWTRPVVIISRFGTL